MDQLKLQLKQDFFQQAARLVAGQEQVFLQACEERDSSSLETIGRFICLLKGMARSSKCASAYKLLDEVEKFIGFCLENIQSLTPKDKEVFIEFFDCFSSYFSQSLGHGESFTNLLSLCEGVKIKVESRNRLLSFRIGSNEKSHFEKERAQVYQLAQDLNILHKGFEAGAYTAQTIKHLGSLTQKLLEAGKKLNEQKISDLYHMIGKSLERKTFKFGFYGGEHKIEKNALAALAAPLINILENAYFSSDKELIEIMFKASKEAGKEGNVRLEAQLSGCKIERSFLQKLEQELEGLGFQVFSHVDEFSGIAVFIDIPQIINTIEGQVARVNGQSYALDMRYVKESVKLTNENTVSFNQKKFYVNYQDRPVPIVPLRQRFNMSHEGREGKYAIILEMKGDWAAVPVDSLEKRQSLHIKPIDESIIGHEYFKSLCFLDSSLPVFLLDSKKMIQEEKANEAKLVKFLEVGTGYEDWVAVETKDIQEVVPLENVSLIPNENNCFYGVMNYQGSPLMVYSLYEKLGIEGEADLQNALVCKADGKLFALAIGSSARVRTLRREESYGSPAFAHDGRAGLCKGAYLFNQKEVIVADVEKLLQGTAPANHLKKVA